MIFIALHNQEKRTKAGTGVVDKKCLDEKKNTDKSVESEELKRAKDRIRQFKRRQAKEEKQVETSDAPTGIYFVSASSPL